MKIIVNALVLTHLMPMVPLTWALRAAGHEVLVVGDTDVVRAAGQAGLAARRVGPVDGTASRWSRPLVKKSPFTAKGSGGKLPDEEPPWAAMGRRWVSRLETYLDEYAALARAWRPDLIITDPLEWGGLIVGGALGVPVVVHRWGIDNMSSTLAGPARQALDPLSRRIGGDGLPDPAMIVDPCPPSVRSPNVTAEQPVRFLPYNGTGDLPDWVLDRGPSRRVVISLGAWGTGRLAEQGRLPGIVSGIGAALAELHDLEAVLLLAPEFRAALGDPPPSIRLADPLPINLCLPGADAVIHHGGSGTALTACHFGVPQLVLAQDGPLLVPNAERVQAAGAGLALIDEAERDDPRAIAAALTRLLTEPGHADGAARVAREMAGLPTPARVASLIENLATLVQA